MFDTPKLLRGGDWHLLIWLGDGLSFELNFRCMALHRHLKEQQWPGVLELVASYNTVLIKYDPQVLSHARLSSFCREALHALAHAEALELPSRLIEIPVAYDDRWTRACVEDYCRKIKPIEHNPTFVARTNGLANVEELVRRHASTDWWVGHIGFLMGLPVMMPLDMQRKLTAPKYNPPRMWTPKGTVALGGAFTAIFPIVAPDGYQVLGRTPVRIYDPLMQSKGFEHSPFLFRVGDRVRFAPISEDQFLEIEKEEERGTHQPRILESDSFGLEKYQTLCAKW